MNMTLVKVVAISLVVGLLLFALTTPPVRVADVKNGELQLRYYYDYRKGAKAVWYFAQMQDGKPTGKLYAVKLHGRQDESRNRIIQFSSAGVSDFNPGTLVTTIPADSAEAREYHEAFTEVQRKYETQKWEERIWYN